MRIEETFSDRSTNPYLTNNRTYLGALVVLLNQFSYIHQCLNMSILNRFSGANEFWTINLLFKSIDQIIFYPSTNSTLVPNLILKTFKINFFNGETTPATLKLSCSWDQINVSIRQRIGNLKKTYIGDHRMTISNHSSELR